MPKAARQSLTFNGFKQGFKVERRPSHVTRPSTGVNSPEPPDSPDPQSPEKDAWLMSWEHRLKLREATLEAQGIRFPKSRATPVLDLECVNCRCHLSWQGMQVYYKNNSSVDMYSSDQPPNGTREVDFDMNHGLCGCRIREFDCRCGTSLGYQMHSRCASCKAGNDEDDGHRWFFQADCIKATPSRDTATGETLMWPGWDFPNGCDSTLEESSIDVRPDVDTAHWGCSPLADRNGRARTSQAKPENVVVPVKDTELAQKNAALDTLAEELAKREAAQFEADLNQASREKYLRDVTTQQENTGKELAVREAGIVAREKILNNSKLALDAREYQLQEQHQAHQQSHGTQDATKLAFLRAEQKATAAEEKVAFQTMEIQQLCNTVAELRREVRRGVDGMGGLMGRGRLPEVTEENTVELDALLHQARQRSSCHAPAASRMQSSNEDIDRLRRELDISRSELAQLRPELHQAQQRLERKEAELERILPEIVASRTQGTQRLHCKDAEIGQMRRELDSARVELARKKLDLKQAQQDLEIKDSEIGRLLPQVAVSRMQGAQHFHSNDAEVERLRRELDTTRAELARQRPEIERLRVESRLSTFAPTGTHREGPDDFVQGRLDAAQKLAEKNMALERREQDVASREASLSQGSAQPSMVTMQRFAPTNRAPVQPHFYGGSGVPAAPGGGLWERLGF